MHPSGTKETSVYGASEYGLGGPLRFGGGAAGKKMGVNFRYTFLEAGEKLERLRFATLQRPGNNKKVSDE